MGPWKKLQYRGEPVFVDCPQSRTASRENAYWYGETVSGATIYAYVGGNPIRYTDPLGLYYAELYGAGGATLGAYAGAGLAGVGAAAGDIGTLGGNILLNPAEVAGGYALGGLVGGGFGYAVGSGLDWLNNNAFNNNNNNNNVDPLDPAGNAGHQTGARESTKDQHEAGDARRKRDRGGEKGDDNRCPPRRKPQGWKGPWPP